MNFCLLKLLIMYRCFCGSRYWIGLIWKSGSWFQWFWSDDLLAWKIWTVIFNGFWTLRYHLNSDFRWFSTDDLNRCCLGWTVFEFFENASGINHIIDRMWRCSSISGFFWRDGYVQLFSCVVHSKYLVYNVYSRCNFLALVYFICLNLFANKTLFFSWNICSVFWQQAGELIGR